LVKLSIALIIAGFSSLVAFSFQASKIVKISVIISCSASSLKIFSWAPGNSIPPASGS
jgi:hypothetical protein